MLPFCSGWRNSEGELVAKSTGKPTSAEALAFLQRLQFAEAQIADSAVVRDEKRKAVYQMELLSYGRTGLEHGDVATAVSALNWFEARVADQEGPILRRRHIIATIRTAGCIGLPALLAALALPHLIPASSAFFLKSEAILLHAVLWMLVGNALGVTFFAFVRNLDLRFDQLSKFDPAKLEPWLRFLLVAVTTAILAVVMAVGALQVGIGGKLLNDFLTTSPSIDPLLCVVVGILAGYSDTTISGLLAGALKPDVRSERT